MGERPFLLYLSFYSVPIPLQAKKELVAKYEEKWKRMKHAGPLFKPEGDRGSRQVQSHAVYAAMIESMDHAVGEVLDAMERLDLADRTALFFMSDNGGLSTSEGSPTSNLPLRAGKGWLWTFSRSAGSGIALTSCRIMVPGLSIALSSAQQVGLGKTGID